MSVRDLLATPLGSCLWTRSGTLFVQRCNAGELRPGDLAVILTPRSQLVTRVVLATAPWRAADLRGRGDDAAPSAVVARVERVRLGGVAVPVSRQLVLSVQGALSSLYGNSRARALLQATRGFLLSGATAAPRRLWLGEIDVRALTVADEPELQRFVARWLPANPAFLHRQLETRWSTGLGGAVGGFSRAGRMVGFAYFDEYRQEGVALEGAWIRLLFTVPVARELGVAREIVSQLCAGAARQGHRVLHADVRANNSPSISLFRDLGFIERPDGTELLAPLHALLGGAELLWFERHLRE